MENPIPVGSLLAQNKDLLLTDADQTINRNNFQIIPDEREFSGVITTTDGEGIANQSDRGIEVN